MTYDSWKTTEPDSEPARDEHRPLDAECDCEECVSEAFVTAPRETADPAEVAAALATSTADEALGRSICSFIPLLSYDEKRVIDVIIQRILKVGRDSYAPLDLARDARDWTAEAAAELGDTLFYLAAREVAANDKRLEQLRSDAAAELAQTTIGGQP